MGELLDTQALLADTQRRCSAVSDGALDARDEALRELDALRVEHDTKDSQLRSLVKELRERERAAEDEAVDAKETEDCIEAARSASPSSKRGSPSRARLPRHVAWRRWWPTPSSQP